MKTRKFIVLFLASVIAGTFFSGCKEYEYESRIKELILKDMKFPSDATTDAQTFRHEDLSNYSISSNSSWCTPKILKDSCQIQVSVGANTSYDQRQAVVTLTDIIDTTQTRTFNVIQAQLDGLQSDTTYFTVSTAGGQVRIPFKTNVSFSVKIDEANADWITWKNGSTTRGLQDTSVVVNVAKNESYEERTGYVYIVSDSDPDLKLTVTIDQKFDAYLSVDTLKLSIDELGGIVKVTVKTNIAYDVNPQDNWISKSSTKEQNDTTFIESLRVEEFTEKKKSRYGYVIIENAAYDDLQQKIKITQTRALYIEEGVSVAVGKSDKISVTNNTGDDDLTWESSNKSVATVKSDGTVTGVAVGTTMITVTSSDGDHTYSVLLTVTEEESGDSSGGNS